MKKKKNTFLTFDVLSIVSVRGQIQCAASVCIIQEEAWDHNTF